MAESYPEFPAGQRISAGLLRSAQWQTLRKTSDTSRTATATPTADPHLQFDLAANGVYIWSGWLKFDASTTGDIQLDFSGPAGILGEWRGLGSGIDRVISATNAASPAFVTDTVSTTGYLIRMETNDVTAARTFGGLGVGNQLTIDLKGTIRNGSTAGTWSMDWAQRVSDAAATTVYTDSWISLLRVA